MNANESDFFREAALRICSSLEIEIAMQRCLEYLCRFLPASHFCFHIYDRELGIVETVAMATIDDAQTMALRTPLSPRGRRQVEDQRSLRTKQVNRLGDDAVAGPVARQLGVPHLSGLLLDLALEGKFVGTVSVFCEPNIKFNHHHEKLLAILNEPFAIALANCIRFRELQVLREMLEDDNRYLQEELRHIAGDEVVGGDLGLKAVMELVNQVAALNSPVLLMGETGVGKEVIANAIHKLSLRCNGPFIRVNCGAMPATLMDSELFGHEKGAFTGAVSRKRGRFERADGGTIFLDEIAELSPEAQVRLLRVLQEKEIERVGGIETIPVDIRVLAATHRNLEKMVADGGFREDLYYRLRVFPITIPPLRKRRQDIPALLSHFIQKKSREMKRSIMPRVETGTLDMLLRYPWPGNVRELENAVERDLILCKKGTLTFRDILSSVMDGQTGSESHVVEEDKVVLPLDAVMSIYIRKVLKQCNGQIEGEKGAAKLLAIHPSTLRKRMKKLGIPFGREVKKK